MNHSDTLKECRKLAKNQNVTFKRSKKVNKINGLACYEIESGKQYKTLHQGCLNSIYDTLLSESLSNK